MIARDRDDTFPCHDPRATIRDRSRAFLPAGIVAGLFGDSRRAGRCGRVEQSRTTGAIVAETPRLILRRHARTDFPAYFTMSADPDMTRFAGRVPAGTDEAWMRLLRQAGHWSLFGYGFLAIEEKATGCFVGEAGLAHFRRELGPEFDGVPEAGWAIAPWAQGHGYATEAAAAALSWCEAEFGMRRTVCVIHAGNAASIGVARKLGYTPLGECAYRGYSAIMFERLRASNARGK
jgi:RimJ/RimL family protein N-acetyltransferase